MNNESIQAIKKYAGAYRKAKDYIMENNGWSQSTYYRKMNQCNPLTEAETDTIAEAYRKFIYEPLNTIVSQQIFS